MVGAIATLSNGIAYDGIVFCFQKHPVNTWLSALLNPIYSQTMPMDTYDSLFTSNTKLKLKAESKNSPYRLDPFS